MFADLALAQRLEAADAAKYADYAHARTCVVPDLNPAVLPVAGGHAIYAGANSPYSRAVGIGLSGPVSEGEFGRLEGFYRKNGTPTQISFCPLADRSLLEILGRRGYRVEMFMQVWHRPLTGGEPLPPLPPSIEVRPIFAGEAEAWVRTCFKGGLDTEEADAPRTATISAYPFMRQSNCYLALLENDPAGAGMLGMHEGLAELYGAATRLPYRRRGVQAALLAGRLRDASRAGCDLATVHTEPGSDSQRNVERAGFKLAYTKAFFRGP
jgi:hypothetical protein